MLSAVGTGAPREDSAAVDTKEAAVRAREAAGEAGEVEGSGVAREAAARAREVAARAMVVVATARGVVARVVVVWAVVAKEGEAASLVAPMVEPGVVLEVAAVLEELPGGEVDGRVETGMAEVVMGAWTEDLEAARGATLEADVAVAELEQGNRATGETWVEAEALRGDTEVATQAENLVDNLVEAPRAAIWLVAAAGMQGPTLLEGPRLLSPASRQACAILVR